MSLAGDAISAIERLVIPQGPLAGECVRLADFQRDFVEGLLSDGVNVGCWSIGRGNSKTATAAALATTHLAGEWDAQPQREVTIAARTRDQAATGFNFCRSFIEAMPELAGRVTIRKSPLLEIEIDAPDGPHRLKAVPSTGKAVLGGAATLRGSDVPIMFMSSRMNHEAADVAAIARPYPMELCRGAGPCAERHGRPACGRSRQGPAEARAGLSAL
jgi:hypothetical protein